MATGLCDFAITSDTLGESRVPAACCGLFGYRATPSLAGPLSAEAAASAVIVGGGLLEGAAVMARSAATIVKVAQAMGITGDYTVGWVSVGCHIGVSWVSVGCSRVSVGCSWVSLRCQLGVS